MDAELCPNRRLVRYVRNTDERIVSSTLTDSARYYDLLNQPKLERTHGVEPVDQIVGITMCGGIPKGAERVERLYRFLRLLGAVHRLRFIDNDNGACSLHEFDGLTT